MIEIKNKIEEKIKQIKEKRNKIYSEIEIIIKLNFRFESLAKEQILNLYLEEQIFLENLLEEIKDFIFYGNEHT